MDEPLTREEQYLSAIAGAGEVPDYPITRVEQYLAKIAGEDVEYPEVPVTRVEEYLKYIAEHPAGDVTVESLSVTENGTYTAPSGKAYTPVSVNVPSSPAVDVEPITITENGTYTAEDGEAYSPVTVNVPSAELETKSVTVTENGTSTISPSEGNDGMSSVSLSVNVPQGIPIEVSTSAGMSAVLTAANVGKAYKFTGTTDSDYTNGDIYVVEAE